MDPKTIALIGPGIAAVSGIIIAFVSHGLQMRRERRARLRNKKEEAYQNSIRYLSKLLISVSSELQEKSEMTLPEGISLAPISGLPSPPDLSEEMTEAYIWTRPSKLASDL